MRSCDALLLDLDGTLVDSRRDIAEALNGALAEHGLRALALDAVAPLIGDGARVLVRRALEATAAPAELVEPVFGAFQRHYRERPCVHTRLLPGARELLGLGLPLAVVTNKPREVTLLVLEQLGILAAFGAVWAGGDGPLKPAPDGPRWCAARLGVAVERAWCVGDGPQDVQAGRAAGCFTVAVPGIAARDQLLAAGPDLVVATLLELHGMIA